MNEAGEPNPIRVMVVDDNPVVRSGLISLLEASNVAEVVAEAGDGQQAATEAERTRPDLVLLDVRMPLVDGVEAAGLLSRRTRVLMLTYTDDPEVVRAAIRNGACGYLVHGTFSPDELGKAVQDAVAGSHPLSPSAAGAVFEAVRQGPAEVPDAPPDPGVVGVTMGLSAREVEVLQLISEGNSNGEIAQTLFLSEKTVKNHVNRVYAKLAVESRGAAIARWHAALSHTGRTGVSRGH